MIKVQEVLTVVKVAVQQEKVQREKLMKYLKQRSQKKAKKEEKKKKSAHDKGKQNGSQPAKLKEETLNDFLKKKDLKKWHYVIDMVSPEDIEAIDILITQR